LIKTILLLFIMSNFLFSDVALVKKMTGTVEVKRNKKIITIKIGSSLKNGDIIISKANSSVGIVFDDGSRLSLGEKAILVIKEFKVKPEKNEFNVDMTLKKGKAVFNSGTVGKLAPESVKFRIPEGVIGIRGTQFAVEVE